MRACDNVSALNQEVGIKRFFGIILAGLAIGAGIYAAKQAFVSSPFPPKRHFALTYRTVVSDLPETANQVRVWIPLASSRDGQKVLKREIESPLPYTINSDPVFGNEMLYAETTGPAAGNLEFKIDYEVVVDGQARPVPEGEGEIEKFLKPSRLMVVNDEVKAKAKAATAGKKTWWEKAYGIYDYVIRHMSYDKSVPGWGEGNTVRACLLGKGNCTDFHSLFISIAHASEIPSRFKIGFTIPNEGEGTIPGYHCWAEFFDEKRGWTPVDASEAWKHPRLKRHYFGRFDTNKFLVSLGRDIRLVPAQAGEPVNIFIYPEVEIDGKSLAESPAEIQKDFYFKTIN